MTAIKYSALDSEIRPMVRALRAHDVETFESCQGGTGHAYPVRTVRFHGEKDEGFRAYAAAIREGLPVDALRRVWLTVGEELTGPYWEMTFHSRGQRPDESAT